MNALERHIVIPNNFEETELTAASELQKYLEKVFGTKLDIINESQNHNSAIYVGHTNYAQTSSINTNSKENWIIKVQGSNLVLKGGLVAGDRGIHIIESNNNKKVAMYYSLPVCDFLEKRKQSFLENVLEKR